MAFFRKKKKLRSKKRSSVERSFAWQIVKGILRFILFVGIIILTYYLTRLPFFTINSINVDGGETIPHEDIRDITNSELEGTYFRLIPKRFTYMYPKERIIYVLEKLPRVHSVDISRISKNELQITFEEYIPHSLWCKKLSSSTPCYFLDDKGFAFAEAPILNGGTFIRHFVSDNENYKLGNVIETKKLDDIYNFIDQAETVLNFRIKSLEHMTDGDVSLRVNGGGTIFVSLNKDLVNTLENIAATLSSDDFSHIEPGNFQYIDARFENKIFINENIEVSTSTEELSE